MDRRQFIREVFLWSAGATLTIPRFNILPEALAAEKPQSLLSVAKGEEYSTLVARVLAPLGGMKQFVRPGDRVVVKPNIGWDRNPEQAATTHPLVVQALVVQALEAGAKKFWFSTGPATSSGAATSTAASNRRFSTSTTRAR